MLTIPNELKHRCLVKLNVTMTTFEATCRCCNLLKNISFKFYKRWRHLRKEQTRRIPFRLFPASFKKEQIFNYNLNENV